MVPVPPEFKVQWGAMRCARCPKREGQGDGEPMGGHWMQVPRRLGWLEARK